MYNKSFMLQLVWIFKRSVSIRYFQENVENDQNWGEKMTVLKNS